jgi:hypothetical protein
VMFDRESEPKIAAEPRSAALYVNSCSMESIAQTLKKP